MKLPVIPICTHIKVNGEKCKCSALKGRTLCYFHDVTERRRRANSRAARRIDKNKRRAINIPVLEDANAIQIALMETIDGLLDRRLERTEVGLLLYALQTASANLKRTNFDAPKESSRASLFGLCVQEAVLKNRIQKMLSVIKQEDEMVSMEALDSLPDPSPASPGSPSSDDMHGDDGAAFSTPVPSSRGECLGTQDSNRVHVKQNGN